MKASEPTMCGGTRRVVSPDCTPMSNGEVFYRRADSGSLISVPTRQVDRPNRDFLTWHADSVFLAS